MFSIKLKEKRIEYGLSQENFAKKIGYSQSMIARWEKAECEPTQSAIIKIAQFFEVSTDYLLGLTNDIGMVQVQSELSSNESKLLAYYNSLDEDGQSTLLDIARIAASADQSKAVKPQKIS